MASWYEPQSRFWHSSQLVGESVVVRGGCIPGIDSKRGRHRMMKRIEEFDIKARRWRDLKTKGDRHPGLSAVACASSGKHLFAYGGLDGVVLNGVLSQLDLETLEWIQLSPKTSAGPLRKDASGMVHFGDGKLAVVCGYAYPSKQRLPNGGSSDPGSTFIPRNGVPDDGSGWTNEMHIFDLELRAWLHLVFKGPRPPPCADFALISIDKYRAVLYGGRRGTDHDSKDIYLIDFTAMEIMKIQPGDKNDPWPKIRLGQQAACCLGFNTKCAQLLITGGRRRQEMPLSDMWLFDLMSKTWKKFEIPENIRGQIGRWGHTATTITHSNGLEEVLMFGGCPGYYEVVWEVKKDKDYLRLSGPLSFIFGFIGKEWKLLDVVDSNMEWKADSFDIDSEFTLGALYSMEQEGIPVLTELMSNSGKFSSMIGATEIDQQAVIYKWPTLHVPSYHKPTWKKLRSILKVIEKENLAEAIKRYLKKVNDPHDIPGVDTKGYETTSSEIEKIGDQMATLTVDDSPFNLRGVELCGETLLTITNTAQTFKWEGYGLTVHIPENSLPQGTEKIGLNIGASIAGHYEFPANSSLVSAIFWFRCEPMYNFEKQLTVEIQHCAKSENVSKLSFVRAVCTQELLPYTFKPLEGGQFTNLSSYGIVKLNRFSGIATVQEGSDDKEYYASLFYLGQEPSINKYIHFVVTMNTKVHLTVIKKEYDKKSAQLGLAHVVGFISDRITLDIPMEGTGDLNGWKIIPLMRPVILKEVVDQFEPGKGIPSCQLIARVVESSKREPLIHTVNLEGAKEPYDVFTIHIEEDHKVRKRSASDPDVSSTTKKRREQTQKSHSLDPKMPTIDEDEMKEVNTAKIPSIKLLTLLKWKNAKGKTEKFKTKLQLAPKWREIGVMLDISPAQLDLWGKEKDALECCEAVLYHWLSHPTEEYPATWEGLYELMDDCDFGIAVSDLKRAVENAIY